MFISSKLRTALVLVVVALLPYYVTIMAQPSSSKSFGRAKFELVIEEDDEYNLILKKGIVFSSMAMSAAGTTIAICSKTFDSGFVNIYEGNSFDTRREWEIPKDGIPGPNNLRIIEHLSCAMSSDGTTVATASTSYSASTNGPVYSGQVRVFQKDSSQMYMEISSDFKGNGACADAYRYSLALSDDGQTMAIRAYDDTECDVVRFYQKFTSDQVYEQVGSDIILHEVEESDYKPGGPLLMSDDGITFAILLYNKVGIIGSSISQQVRVYDKNTSSQSYEQQFRLDIGGDINYVVPDSTKLALSADGTTLVLNYPPETFVYQKDPADQEYKQIGPGILRDEREAAIDEPPIAVSADGSRIALSVTLIIRDENCQQFPCDPRYIHQVHVYENTDGSSFEKVASIAIPTDYPSGSFLHTKLDMTADGTTIAASVECSGCASGRVYSTKKCLLGFGIFDNLFCPLFGHSLRRFLRSLFE